MCKPIFWLFCLTVTSLANTKCSEAVDKWKLQILDVFDGSAKVALQSLPCPGIQGYYLQISSIYETKISMIYSEKNISLLPFVFENGVDPTVTSLINGDTFQKSADTKVMNFSFIETKVTAVEVKSTSNVTVHFLVDGTKLKIGEGSEPSSYFADQIQIKGKLSNISKLDIYGIALLFELNGLDPSTTYVIQAVANSTEIHRSRPTSVKTPPRFSDHNQQHFEGFTEYPATAWVATFEVPKKKSRYSDLGHFYVAKSDIEGAGDGVFSKVDIPKGTIVERANFLTIPFERTFDLPMMHYVFRNPKKEGDTLVLLGYGGLYNHNDDPHLAYTYDYQEDRMIFTAVKDIKAGEEVFVSYGTEWWETRNKQ